jgi:hypothetical protein
MIGELAIGAYTDTEISSRSGMTNAAAGAYLLREIRFLLNDKRRSEHLFAARDQILPE